jgi:hypothetical protein
MFPERGAGAGFAATLYGIDASPWPFAAAASDIHGASTAADQLQSRAAMTETVPLPPFAVNEDGLLLTEIAHLLEVGAVSEVDDDVQRAAASARNAAPSAESRRVGQCIGSTGADLMHGARQNAYAIFATARSS